MDNQDLDNICINCKKPLGDHSAKTDKCPAPNREALSVNWLETKFCSTPSPFLILPEERELVISVIQGAVENSFSRHCNNPALNAIIDRFTDPKNQEVA